MLMQKAENENWQECYVEQEIMLQRKFKDHERLKTGILYDFLRTIL